MVYHRICYSDIEITFHDYIIVTLQVMQYVSLYIGGLYCIL